MVALSDEKRQIVQSVIAAAPDSAVRSLELALASAGGGDGLLNGVRGLVEIEASDRLVRNTILSPIVGLCRVREAGALSFPVQTKAQLWQALKRIEPDLVKDATARCNTWDRESLPPAPFDALCAAAARAMRADHVAFEALTALPDADSLVACLDMAPLVRAASMRLDSWLNHMTPERQVAARLAYRDASAVAEDSGPRFFEMLSASLPEPHLILHVISAMMDRPGERFLASSELAFFGDRAVAGIQARIDQLGKHDSNAAEDQAAGAAAGLAVSQILHIIDDFMRAVALRKDGRWGKAVFQQKQNIARQAEKRLNVMSKLVQQALPTEAKFGSRARGVPRLNADPDPQAIERAAGALAFSEQVRSAAVNGGFGAARAKALEAIDEHLDHYIEDVLSSLRDKETEGRERMRAYLDVAARLVGLARNEKAERIVRRRIAAA
jgi:hypothetical protein